METRRKDSLELPATASRDSLQLPAARKMDTLPNAQKRLDSLRRRIQKRDSVLDRKLSDSLAPGARPRDSVLDSARDSTGRGSRQEDSIPGLDADSTQALIKGLSQMAQQQKKDSITIKNYKIISQQRDTSYLDTTQGLHKEYKYNYLRRDLFELMPFANIGRPYNRLGRDFRQQEAIPALGAHARMQAYMEKRDFKYYHVATPLTELMFKTSLDQGQFLDAELAMNLSPYLNVYVAYRGFRSLGKYRFEQAESGVFRTAINYFSPNGKYELKAHYAYQDLENEENGGLLNSEVQFESGDDQFRDRSRIDVNFTNAYSRVLGRRYHIDQRYNLVRAVKDSLNPRKTQLTVGHSLTYDTRYYQFTQTNANELFGTSAFVTPISDRPKRQELNNQFLIEFNNPVLGRITGLAEHYYYNYFLQSQLITDSGVIPGRLDGQEVLLGGEYRNRLGPLSIQGKVRVPVQGEVSGNLLEGEVRLRLAKDLTVGGNAHLSSRQPSFNALLMQSDYLNFNWNNTETFDKQQVQQLEGFLESRRFGNLTASVTRMQNYTYFATQATPEQYAERLATASVVPFQETDPVTYLKVNYDKEVRFLRYFGLRTRFQYQTVTQSNQVVNVPEFISRTSLYWGKDIFRKAMYLHTGVTVKYFPRYNMDGYHPLLGEFFVQNQEEIGGFPMVDIFVNAKVRQTRIFFKLEHLNSSFSENNFFSAPGYPYRDFVIRFGVVWNFFS